MHLDVAIYRLQQHRAPSSSANDAHGVAVRAQLHRLARELERARQDRRDAHVLWQQDLKRMRLIFHPILRHRNRRSGASLLPELRSDRSESQAQLVGQLLDAEALLAGALDDGAGQVPHSAHLSVGSRPSVVQIRAARSHNRESSGRGGERDHEAVVSRESRGAGQTGGAPSHGRAQSADPGPRSHHYSLLSVLSCPAFFLCATLPRKVSFINFFTKDINLTFWRFDLPFRERNS